MSTNVIKQTIVGEPGSQTIKMVVRSNERGPKGEKGDPGIQGPQGIPGPRGYDGVIQYRAGTGINISPENIITATGDATAAWGGIQGNINSQTDLQNALNAKQDVMADFTGANGVVGGTSGKVPAPAATDNVKFLKGDGTWSNINSATLTMQSNGVTAGTYNGSTNKTINIVPPVKVGEVLSQPTDVAYVDTVNIVDEAVTADKIDLSTLGGNYSTSEVDTGYTWIDGKHIYKKTVDLGGLPDSSNKNVAHGITGLSRVIKQETWAYASGTNMTLFVPHDNTLDVSYQIGIVIEGANISIRTGSDQTAFTEAYTTLYYTKTS